MNISINLIVFFFFLDFDALFVQKGNSLSNPRIFERKKKRINDVFVF